MVGCGPTIITGSPPGDTGPVADGGVAPDSGAPVDRPTPVTDTGPRQCTGPGQCGAGAQCFGGPGCGIPWTCQPQLGRACTADFAPFCGCDGVTFGASSTCPDRPYLHPGPCEMPPPPFDGGVMPPPPFDGGVTPTGCVMPDGRVCALGSICELPVECAQCRCTTRGLQCVMTPCVDGGIVPPPLDVGPATCTIRGVTCAVNEVCVIDRCTQCLCGLGGDVSCRSVPGCGVDAGTIVVDSGVIRRDAGTIGVDASVRGCAAQDATGQGLCDRLLGIYWEANRCVAIGGCSCVGADCARSYESFQACEMAHLICPR